MARTQILPTDAGALKAWSAKVAVSAAKQGFWSSKMTGPESTSYPWVQKFDLEANKTGDNVTVYLIAKLQGKPVEGDEKLEGRELKMKHYTDKVAVDKLRQGVNVGDLMDEKRVAYNIATQARGRLADYMSEVEDELKSMYISGARGVGAEILHYETSYTGFAGNAFNAPDTSHQTWSGAATSKATLATTDKLTLGRVNYLKAKVRKFTGGGGKGHKMLPVSIEGGKHFVFALAPESMYDLRQETGDAGWLNIQKAAAAAEGRNNPIFTGADGMYNGVILQEHENAIRFNDYGAGANVNAVRNLFLGANAGIVAYGMRLNGMMRYQIMPSDVDHGEEDIIIVRTVLGIKKAIFNSQDYGLISEDSAYTTIT
jgi:N4-gp56 family major capsid protein